MKIFGNLLTFKWQFFGGSGTHRPVRGTATRVAVVTVITCAAIAAWVTQTLVPGQHLARERNHGSKHNTFGKEQNKRIRIYR